MFVEGTSLGLDMDARSVVASALDTVTVEVVKSRLIPDHEIITEWVQGFLARGRDPVRGHGALEAAAPYR